MTGIDGVFALERRYALEALYHRLPAAAREIGVLPTVQAEKRVSPKTLRALFFQYSTRCRECGRECG